MQPADTPHIERIQGPPRRPRPGPAAQYRLTAQTRVPAGIEEVFAFFSRAENLALLTPPWMDFRILSHDAPLREGARIRYRLRLGPIPVRWLTRIAVWEPGRRFVDDQRRGPYRLWWHEHRFEAVDGGVRMEDEVLYRVPFGPLGRLAHAFLVAPTLRRIFLFRSRAIARHFSPDPEPPSPRSPSS